MIPQDPRPTRDPRAQFEIDSTLGHDDTGNDSSFDVRQRSQDGTPGDQFGNYRLVERLGEGGFGTVWRAEQSAPVQREVALKILKSGMDSREVVARFAQERQALAVMDHPGIAKVLDAGIAATGRPYFVMELVRGSPINVYCDERQLGTGARLNLFIHVCLAVQHAHQKGVIHRDLKPSNILVCDLDAGAQPKVIDFGIAKATAQPLTDVSLHTQVGQFMGTPAYMSPEQADGLVNDLDTRADVYSLGAVLYQLLTGQMPFDNQELKRGGHDELLRRIREQTALRPSTRLKSLAPKELEQAASSNGLEPMRLVQAVRGDLDWIVMKALEKDRTRRYDTAQDLASDIRRHLNNEPVLARPPSASYLFRRFVVRHREVVTAAALILITLIAGLAVSTTLLFREANARAKADKSATKSQQVAQFLKQMLESVGPSKAQGRDATMLREILDATAARVGTELADLPDVEAELRSILGTTYEDLSEYDKALDMHRETLRLRRTFLPSNDPLMADSLYDLASTLDYMDKLDEAETALRESIEIRETSQPIQPTKIASSRELLAWLLYRRGRLKDAEKEARQALELLDERDPEAQNVRTRALISLSSILLRAAQFKESVEIHRQAVSEVRNVNGEMHPRYISTLNNLCHALVKVGEFDEAERIANQALGLELKITGKPIGDCTDSLNKVLAAVYMSRNNYPKAIEALNIAVNAASEMFGPNHRFTIDKRSLLIRAQVAAGMLDEAEKTLNEARAGGGRESAENSLEVAASALALARGDFATAEREARTELNRARKVAGMPTIEMVDAMQALASAQFAQGQSNEAATTLREAIAIMRPDLNSGTPILVRLQADLAKVLAAIPPNDSATDASEETIDAKK